MEIFKKKDKDENKKSLKEKIEEKKTSKKKEELTPEEMEEKIKKDKEEARKILDEAAKEYREKREEKEKKAKDKLDKKLEAKLELGTPITDKVAELVSSGVVKKEDLIDPVTNKIKNFLDIIEEYEDHPQDDEPEVEEKAEEPEEEKSPEEKVVPPFGGNIVNDKEDNPEHTPAFNMGYTMSEDGKVEQVTSAAKDTEASQAPNSDIQDLIINDPDIKEIYPSIDRNDISVNNGLILIKIPREGTTENGEPVFEVFRLDIIGNQIYVQAPLEYPFPNINTGVMYYYVSVPVCTDIGKEILKNTNYAVKGSDLDISKTIFRDTENAA